MTIANTTVRTIYQGNGSTTTFAVGFDHIDNDDVEVYLRDETDSSAITETLQTITTQYTLDADPAVNVEMITAPTANQKLMVIRNSPDTQATDLLDGGTYSQESLENALDKLTRLVQQVQQDLKRCVKYKVSTPDANLDMELPEPVANEYLAFNSAADGIESVADSTSPVITPAIPSVIGTTASPIEIAAGTGIISALDDLWFTTIYIAGQGGAVDITASDQIKDGDFVGKKLKLIGTSDANYVLLESSGNVALNGNINIMNQTHISLEWDGSAWQEDSRSN